MADYFGKQTFLNQKGKEIVENTVFYKFTSKKDFERWQKTDLKQFDLDADLRLTRQKATKQEFETHKQEKGKITSIAEFEIKNIDKNARYLHIAHPDPRYKKDFGLVLKFDSEETKRDFVKKQGEFYKSTLKELKPTDKRVMTANAHGLFLEHSKNNQNFPMTLNLALKNYPLLNPAKRYLAFVSQNDFSKPHIYAFDQKRKRDLFVRTLKNKIAKEKKAGREYPAFVSRAKNFNPIVINHAARGIIREGSLSEHFKNFTRYCSMNSQKETKNLSKDRSMDDSSNQNEVFEKHNRLLTSLKLPRFQQEQERAFFQSWYQTFKISNERMLQIHHKNIKSIADSSKGNEPFHSLRKHLLEVNQDFLNNAQHKETEANGKVKTLTRAKPSELSL